MAMNINNINGNRNNAVDSNRKPDTQRTTQSDPSTTKTSAPQDSVVLTDKARQLNQIEKGLKQGDGQDYDNSKKVAALKQAVADGSYQVNAPRVAQKMGTMEEQVNSLYR
ncbi:flagellar biosynthesis anti-sigma factor FlgM [Celerinatantimonas yamalensis]|uniref:Negative regulator of flagellin synthesis n=1 Tax=Celerinatantimonas yamalensis TaxID=559956 RepID=A0ABW9G6R2_9GAMM